MPKLSDKCKYFAIMSLMIQIVWLLGTGFSNSLYAASCRWPCSSTYRRHAVEGGKRWTWKFQKWRFKGYCAAAWDGEDLEIGGNTCRSA